jgi:hypothetical protein
MIGLRTQGGAHLSFWDRFKSSSPPRPEWVIRDCVRSRSTLFHRGGSLDDEEDKS